MWNRRKLKRREAGIRDCMSIYLSAFAAGFVFGVVVGFLIPCVFYLAQLPRKRYNKHGFSHEENAIIRRNEELLQSGPSDKAQEDFKDPSANE